MNLRYIDPIWHITGSLPLAAGQSPDETFDRLDPLFRETGTSHERADDTLVFRKKDAASQDRMSIFDSGLLRVEPGEAGPVLRYRLKSRALLLCFLAPLLFIGFGQLTLALDKHQKAVAEASGKAAKDKAAAKAKAARLAALPMHPIDKALGAPAPEKPGKKDDDKAQGRKKKPSATAAYVFAGIFAALYIVGRFLEDRLILALFRRTLQGS